MGVTIDLSSEMAEGFALPPLGIERQVLENLVLPASGETWHHRHRLPRFDREVMPYLSSVSLSCGLHSGDPVVLQQLIPELASRGIRIGAHPSYPDTFRFGQNAMPLDIHELEAVFLYQLGALEGVLRAYGQKIQHVKCHGALYFDLCYNERVGKTIFAALRKFDPTIILVLLAGSPLVNDARSQGLRVAEEGFVDRGYDRTGRLVPRAHPDALILEPGTAARRMVEMVLQGQITSVEGEQIPLHAQTFCLHSDTPGADAIAAAVVSELQAAGVSIRPLEEIIP